MFNPDFYPTPKEVIDLMLNGYAIEGKTILEPSAGKGNIVDACYGAGATLVIACENHPDLAKIVRTKCKLIATDFLTLTSEQISHIDMIVMNPPFSKDEQHILHAYSVAPAGCDIIALCNYNTIGNRYTSRRQELYSLIQEQGTVEKLGPVFDTAERKTYTDIGLVRLRKAGENSSSEFSGFFMEEEVEDQENGIIKHSVVRELVNRYVKAMQLFDQQLELGVQMNNQISGFYSSKLAFSVTDKEKPVTKNEFKKDLQKAAWSHVFKLLDMQKYATKGLREDINKFVEKQSMVPFSMRNIYHMLTIVVGTHQQRMDRALLEVFEKLTMHYHDNRYNVEGWKTNSHYLLGRKFIMPNVVTTNFSGGMRENYYGWAEPIEDLNKALHNLFAKPITGKYEDTFAGFFNKHDKRFGERYEWSYFYVRGYKKGTMHFEFKDIDVWGRVNQEIARIKGYPLFEHKTKK